MYSTQTLNIVLWWLPICMCVCRQVQFGLLLLRWMARVFLSNILSHSGLRHLHITLQITVKVRCIRGAERECFPALPARCVLPWLLVGLNLPEETCHVEAWFIIPLRNFLNLFVLKWFLSQEFASKMSVCCKMIIFYLFFTYVISEPEH